MLNPEAQSDHRERKRSGHTPVRPVVWIGSSERDLAALPREVKGSFGSKLYELQQGKTPLDTKPLSQFGSGVCEPRESFDGHAIG
jgi:phage-related protein